MSEQPTRTGVPIVLTHMHSLQADIYDNAYQKGWYEEDRTFGDRIALCHSELSEALEEFRDGHHLSETRWEHESSCPDHQVPVPAGGIGSGLCTWCTPKPEGVPIELADVIIRILDMAHAEGIDMGEAIYRKMQYNKTRPHRHGGKAL